MVISRRGKTAGSSTIRNGSRRDGVPQPARATRSSRRRIGREHHPPPPFCHAAAPKVSRRRGVAPLGKRTYVPPTGATLDPVCPVTMVAATDEDTYPPASILIVDDNAANLTALTAVLDSLGQRVVKASSGEEAL